MYYYTKDPASVTTEVYTMPTMAVKNSTNK